MIECEKRFKLTEEEYASLLSGSIGWSEPVRVTDVTLGLSGATSMQTHGWVVRVRQKGERVLVDYKAPVNEQWSSWEEIEIEVSSFVSALQIFQRVGLKPGLVLDRVRREAEYNGAQLAIDDFSYLGKFIEIEVDGASSDAHRIMNDSISMLELQGKDDQKPYGSMLLEKMTLDADLRQAIERHVNILSSEDV
jgi:predicted adenylyl cyclase CyaB